MVRFSLLAILLISLLPQGDTGQLSGSVVDANGAAILSASAKLISQTTSQLREVATGGVLAGVPEVAETLVPSDKNNISPRVGFALRLNDSSSLVLRGGYGIYYDRLSARYANTQLLNYPYLAVAVGLPGLLRTFANPFIPVPQPNVFPLQPTIPSPLSPLSPIVGVPISGLFVDPELSTPYVQQYNTNIQWEFFKDYLLEVGYVGSKGTKLLQVVSLNQPFYNRAANVFVAPLGTALSTQKMVF